VVILTGNLPNLLRDTNTQLSTIFTVRAHKLLAISVLVITIIFLIIIKRYLVFLGSIFIILLCSHCINATKYTMIVLFYIIVVCMALNIVPTFILLFFYSVWSVVPFFYSLFSVLSKQQLVCLLLIIFSVFGCMRPLFLIISTWFCLLFGEWRFFYIWYVSFDHFLLRLNIVIFTGGHFYILIVVSDQLMVLFFCMVWLLLYCWLQVIIWFFVVCLAVFCEYSRSTCYFYCNLLKLLYTDLGTTWHHNHI